MSFTNPRPLVSVVLPFRNVASTLRAAMESVLDDPSAVPLELVAVDDASTDGSARIAHEIGARDQRVRVVGGPGQGIVAALEKGLAESSAPYVARMDGDDISKPGRLVAQVAYLEEHPTVGAVGTRVEAFTEGPGDVGAGMRHYVDWQNGLLTAFDHRRSIFVEAPLCHPSTMIRRHALDEVGGYRDVAWAEDFDLWLRLDAAGYQLAKLDRVFLRWRHRSGRVTFTDPRCAPAQLALGRAAFLSRRLLAQAVDSPKALWVWGAGPTGKRMARNLEAHGIHVEGFVDVDPRKMGRPARRAQVHPLSALNRERIRLLVAVGARGARDEIRNYLDARDWKETVDYWCVA